MCKQSLKCLEQIPFWEALQSSLLLKKLLATNNFYQHYRANGGVGENCEFLSDSCFTVELLSSSCRIFLSWWWSMSQKRAEAKWLQIWHSWKRFLGINWTNKTRIHKYGPSHFLFYQIIFSSFMCEIWILKWNMNYRRLHWAPVPQHDMPGQSATHTGRKAEELHVD